MGQWIHYEADIFFLMDTIHLLKRNLALEVDAAYFSEKVLDEIRFLDERLSGLSSALLSSTFLLDRNRYIRFLYKTQIAFSELVNAIADGTLGSQIGLSPHSDYFQELGLKKKNEAAVLLASTDIVPEADGDVDQISSEEFKYLFMESNDT
ncbi:hypothetical protein [Sediminispirochaeta smaragdinae]|uniref:Uncharacterized protein n=1 Tax=Sediminispirochaeta smaragdinae (strain DSM 11293 / JCM 15392 / SEBR 4228) TaxID=573413 RepID=E1R298_SEDSS|nr:hypothetical protein [Sediminispirochaeta smaragdinae]ADK81983.1 hypothetical protein Spirs_2880 [Sediminispirochaeta smaragdinae DSM 11293]